MTDDERITRLERGLHALILFCVDGQPARLSRSVSAPGAGSVTRSVFDELEAERSAREETG